MTLISRGVSNLQTLSFYLIKMITSYMLFRSLTITSQALRLHSNLIMAFDMANHRLSSRSKPITQTETFQRVWLPNAQNDTSQEDDELICLARMNIDEFDIDALIRAGLSYDEEQGYSEDFVALTRYGGAIWEEKWLSYNSTYAWHIDCKKWQKEKALYISEEMRMEEISKLLDEGVEVFQTIKS